MAVKQGIVIDGNAWTVERIFSTGEAVYRSHGGDAIFVLPIDVIDGPDDTNDLVSTSAAAALGGNRMTGETNA